MSDAAPIPPGPVPGLRLRTQAEYYAWASEQPRGRFERLDGAVYPMAAERGVHLRRKTAVLIALRDAIAAAGAPCQALPDGATVEIDPGTNFEPDATVNLGQPMADEAVAVPCPIVVVEVPSRSSRKLDSGLKLQGYFSVPSITHYLIVAADRRVVIHHRRTNDDAIDTRIVFDGTITLDPPGITVAVEVFYRD